MTTLRQTLASKLTKKEQDALRASFDVVGDIAIIEIPRELEKKKALIGKTLLSLLKNVKTVAARVGGHKGKYRRQKMKVIAGEKKLETTHKESGIILRLNVETCYYSPRLGTERLRIAKQATPGEQILVVGAGVGPYPLVIAKHSKAAHVTGIELNPTAHKYALENIKLNKLGDRVTAIKGDITKVKLDTKYNRIIIAMPHEGVNIAPSIFPLAKKRASIHILDFAPEDDLETPARRLLELCAQERKCKILRTIRAGQHAVRKYRVCVDAQVG